MNFEDKIYKKLDIYTQTGPQCFEELIVENCIIDFLYLSGVDFKGKVILKDCIFKSFDATGTWFTGGLEITGCLINNSATFEAGLHNKNPVIIVGNIFICFCNFDDTVFMDTVKINFNYFKEGNNFLEQFNKPYNSHESVIVEFIENYSRLN